MRSRQRKVTWEVNENGCWICTSHKPKDRYYACQINGVTKPIHRVMYERKHGSIPDGICVCHKCDNVFCINPDHLFLGTHQDNMEDKASKNRYPDFSGEKNPSAKLTSKQVIEIRNIEGLSQRQIAKIYNITQTMVGYIRRKDNWKHLESGAL